jgi:hypothetical protein
MKVDDLTLTQAADDFYRALNAYYAEPSDKTLSDLVTIAQHYKTLGVQIILIKEGSAVQVMRYSRSEVQCQRILS